MKTIEGDILKVQSGIVIHQVNCKGVMGAGLAKQIKDKFPKVFRDYISHIERYKERGIHPLGSISSTRTENYSIYNFYSQDRYGRNGRQTNYEAFEKCLIGLERRFENSKVSKSDIPVYFPYGIGCGLAGGDWCIIKRLISKYFPDAIIVKYNKEAQ